MLAQDRDRFARAPVLIYLLEQEFREHGCELRTLNDRGDTCEKPDELADGILGQLVRFERAKIAGRSRRGKLHKAREGKLIAGSISNYGFRYNEARDGYAVDEEEMAVVRRIFRTVGMEGVSTCSLAKALEVEGTRSPAGGGRWSKRAIERLILNDVQAA